jgi:hypothetical protein
MPGCQTCAAKPLRQRFIKGTKLVSNRPCDDRSLVQGQLKFEIGVVWTPAKSYESITAETNHDLALHNPTGTVVSECRRDIRGIRRRSTASLVDLPRKRAATSWMSPNDVIPNKRLNTYGTTWKLFAARPDATAASLPAPRLS